MGVSSCCSGRGVHPGVPPTGDGSLNFSNVSSSHGQQFSTAAATGAPLPQGQFFRHSLLQHGSPTGSQVLPGHCSSIGSSPNRSAGPCQEPARAQASHGFTGSSQAFTSVIFHQFNILCEDLAVHLSFLGRQEFCTAVRSVLSQSETWTRRNAILFMQFIDGLRKAQKR